MFVSPNILATQTTTSINEVMVEIGQTVENLFPILFDGQDIDDPSIQKQLGDTTQKISALFKRAKPHFDTKSPTYRISFKVINAQLADARIALKYKNYKHAKNIYKNFVSICSSCHTQDAKLRTLFNDTGRKAFANDLQFAEFNYMTRNYDQALSYYMKYLQNTGNISEADLLTTMKRILFTAAVVKE